MSCTQWHVRWIVKKIQHAELSNCMTPFVYFYNLILQNSTVYMTSYIHFYKEIQTNKQINKKKRNKNEGIKKTNKQKQSKQYQ